ncbi:MAG TPA: glutamate racemase [Ktedonobacterales bacterium]|nr:glutamate racemase [Ktedonobacterales bacterium]
MSERQAPIGVFDSGVGGLTILKDLLQELPAERFIYFGDTGNCPYGVRTESEIQRLAFGATEFLLEHDAKIIVVACNTASVSALAQLRQRFHDIHFVGVVPAVKPAAERTHTGRVGIASTEASARGDYLKRLIAEHANGVQVLAAGCPRLVTLAEAGVLDGPEIEETVRGYIQPMLDAGIDELVLGCTHFPAQRAAFERVAGPGVEVIDSGAAIARQTRRVLERDGHLAGPAPTSPLPLSYEEKGERKPRTPNAGDEFCCSGDVGQFERTAAAILGHPIRASYTANPACPKEE